MTIADHTNLPAGFEANAYYIRSSNLTRSAFEGKFTSINTNITEGMMELEANNAPGWEKGELVEVAVHLTDRHGKVHFLRKAAVLVQPANH